MTTPGLEIVVAAARNGVIGRGQTLPWRLPADLRHFKRLTWGHPVLMGRRTWDGIGRPLPGRQNLVLTRDPAWSATGATGVLTLDGARALVEDTPLMVIGGAQLYQLCLPLARVLHLTEVDADIDGDVRFPEWTRADWRETAREAHAPDAEHAWPYAFVTLERRAA